MSTPSSGPLSGLRIVEFAAIGPAPFAGMLLADMGAQILRIEPPREREARMPIDAQRDPLLRGRIHLTLDLKQPEARERLLSILPHTDVLIEGFRPGVMERLGLGPQECLARAPRLVYGRMTGWGQSGPLAATAGHDPTYIAITGALHAMGYPDRPPTPPLNIVGDFAGGALYLVMGILAALLHARACGQGQVVDASIIDGTTSLMTMVYGLFAAGLWSDHRGTNLLDGSCPFGTAYETADGQYMAVCALEPSFYAELLRRLGLDPASLPAQWDREHWPILGQRFAAVFRQRSRAEWTEHFTGSDACVSPVLSVAEAPAHPHNQARGAFIDGIPAAAPRFSATPTQHAARHSELPHELLRRWGVPPR